MQRPGGGFRLGGNGALNTQSTGWAVQGLLAAGADPASFHRGGRAALDYLDAHQAGDGHYRYSAGSDQTPVWVTGEVLVAAAQEDFPISPPPRAPQAHKQKAPGAQSSATSSATTAGTSPASRSPSPAVLAPLPNVLRLNAQPPPGRQQSPLQRGGE